MVFKRKAAITGIVILFFGNSGLKAQDKTQYLLQEIPQTISLNPAVYYECKNFISLPAISGVGGYLRNNGFSYNQVFEGGNTLDTDSVTFSATDLSDLLWKTNNLRVGAEISLLGVGFNYRDVFYSFRIINNTSFRFAYNKDILDVQDGNWDLDNNEPRDIMLEGSGPHFLNYTEFSLGVSTTDGYGLSVGLSLSYLNGVAHLQTRKSDISLLTDNDPLQLTGVSDVRVRTSMPVTYSQDSVGFISDAEVNMPSSAGSFFFSGNHGLSLDAGIIYEYDDSWVFSASINDLGFIRWKDNTREIVQDEDFIFSGNDLSVYVRDEGSADLLQALEDSVINNFRLSEEEKNYTAMLPFRFFAGAEYKLNEITSFGGVFQSELLSGHIYPTLTLTSIIRPKDWFTASLSYSLMDRWLTNIGFGIILGNEPVQFYVVSDNIPLNYVRETETGMIWPYSSRTFNLRTGLNIILGCKENNTRKQKAKMWRKSCPAYQ